MTETINQSDLKDRHTALGNMVAQLLIADEIKINGVSGYKIFPIFGGNSQWISSEELGIQVSKLYSNHITR